MRKFKDNTIQGQGSKISDFQAREGNESKLKSDIFNPKMLHKCPHALGDNSNPVDGYRWAIDALRKKMRWPSIGLNGLVL